jgi:hypothetical protein
MEKKIIDYLTISGKYHTPTEISLAAGYPKGKNTASTVNPTLYALQKRGLVMRTADKDGRNPRWKIAKVNAPPPINQPSILDMPNEEIAEEKIVFKTDHPDLIEL